jgi:hypothetical protein
MPSDFVLKTMNRVHRGLLKISGGIEERSSLWPRVIADHKNYAGYQTRTSREIPLVLLEPR